VLGALHLDARLVQRVEHLAAALVIRLPASVSEWLRVERTSSLAPSCFSSACTCLLTADWVVMRLARHGREAAGSTTRQKVSIRRKRSMVFSIQSCQE
jgi:hypothetical protein